MPTAATAKAVKFAPPTHNELKGTRHGESEAQKQQGPLARALLFPGLQLVTGPHSSWALPTPSRPRFRV